MAASNQGQVVSEHAGGVASAGPARSRNQQGHAQFRHHARAPLDGPHPPSITPTEVKRILKPVLDFDTRSASEDYFATLPKEIQEPSSQARASE